MFSKMSSTSKPKFLNLHTLAPITVAVLTVYSSAASADCVLTNGVSLTGTGPAVDIYQTDKNLTLTNDSGAALDNVGVEALATADFTFTSNGSNGSLKDISIQGFKGSGTLNISNTNGNALESNYNISGFEHIKITSNTAYGLRGTGKNSISSKNIFVSSHNNAIRFRDKENASLIIENFEHLDLFSETSSAINIETTTGYKSDLQIIGNENSTINIKSKDSSAFFFNTISTANLTIKGRYVNIEGQKSNLGQGSHISITADEINFVNPKTYFGSAVIGGSAGATLVLNAKKISTNDSLRMNAGSITFGESGKTTVVEMKGNSRFTANYIDGGDIVFKFDTLDSSSPSFQIFSTSEKNQLASDSITIEFNHNAIDKLSDQEALESLSKAVDLKGQENNGQSDVLVIGNGTTRTLYTDENGGWTRVGASDITQQTIDLAAESLVAWRNETTTITDRLAALRGNTATMALGFVGTAALISTMAAE